MDAFCSISVIVCIDERGDLIAHCFLGKECIEIEEEL